ncbi:hypothetical protein GCM10009744_59240 [Kribbella alba]|uniref:Uncharacterized protein n=1 Tax=Kribbella alba TaxID=190197 RepID=A0ABN2FTG7_9ACTN
MECTKINSEDWIAPVIYLRNPSGARTTATLLDEAGQTARPQLTRIFRDSVVRRGDGLAAEVRGLIVAVG